VYAKVQFCAVTSDELSFQKGERIQVLRDDAFYDDGWYTGRNEAGHVGIYPTNFTYNPDHPSDTKHTTTITTDPPISPSLNDNNSIDETLHDLENPTNKFHKNLDLEQCQHQGFLYFKKFTKKKRYA
jgi:hypothetical protein